jgi:molybdopterin/thiamine biosynthesis adenylyltransferase
MEDSRYSRQILFPGIGVDGQARLAASRALLVGCGGLGSVVGEILVRAGIGSLTIADRDYVDETNLQRQSLFTEQDCKTALPKAVAAARHLREVNSCVEVLDRVVDVNSSTIEDLARLQDVIVDGSDNFETRYLLNDASWKWGIPWVYGACVGAYGLSVALVPGSTPCLRCILEQMPAPGSSPTCDTTGVIAPIVHVIAAWEAAEVLKLLAGRPEKINRRLTVIDLWENRVAGMDISSIGANPDCPTCGKRSFEFLAGHHETRPCVLCGRDAVQIRRDEPTMIDFATLASRLAPLAEVSYNEHLLRATLGGIEMALFRDGRAILRGVRDLEEARRIYAGYVGI